MIGKVIKQYQKYKPLTATKNLCYHFLTRERKVSYGSDNNDKTFYVIRSIDSNSPCYIGVDPHLLANYFYVLSHLQYARQNNWVPIIDQQNYPVYNSVCNEFVGTQNAWEFFWEQPTSYTLKAVYSSKNVVLSKRSWFSEWDMGYDVDRYTNSELISFYHELARSIPMKTQMAEHVARVYSDFFKPDERVLGVSIRYDGHAKASYLHANGHPISPEIDLFLEIVHEKCKVWNMDRVFLASDEVESVRRFKRAFGDRLIVLPRSRTDSSELDSVDSINPIYLPENIYNTTLNYLTEMELLSRCTGLIGSVTSGLRYAIVMNNNQYEKVEVLDCGRFPDANRRT